MRTISAAVHFAFAAGVLLAVTANAATETYTDGNGIEWTYQPGSEIADGTTSATLGNGSEACIAASASVDAADIPWTFTNNGTSYTVTAIAKCAFNECKELYGTLSIPEAVTNMGVRAFYKCSNLSGIATIGGVTKLNEESFREDSGLEGTDYPDLSRVVTIGKNVFNYCKMGGIVRLDALSGHSNCDSAFNMAAITRVHFPRRAFNLSGNTLFIECKNLTGVYIPGPDPDSGKSLIRRSKCFSGCTSLKVFLAGPHTGLSNNYGKTDQNMFANVSGCRIFVPTGSNWDTETDDEKGLAAYEASNTVFYYGAGRELDLSFDHDAKMITAMPATAYAFTNVLAAAAIFKSEFGYDTRINVTNAIEIAAGSVNAEEMSGVTFDSLTFAVKTQAQLDTVIASVPAAIPLAIDPEGATESLTVKMEDRKIYVMLPTNGTYKIRQGGFIIIVK